MRILFTFLFFFFSSRRRHTRLQGDWSSDVCSSDLGAIVANGTDVPVERIDPMASFHATVTRKTKDGSIFYGDQTMTRAQALKSYTWNGAYAAKEETLKGSIAAGKLADITVLSKDIMTVPDDEIPATTAVYTIVGGKVAYQR